MRKQNVDFGCRCNSRRQMTCAQDQRRGARNNRRKGIAFTEFHASNLGGKRAPEASDDNGTTTRHLEDGGHGLRTERGSGHDNAYGIRGFFPLLHSPDFWSSFSNSCFSVWVKMGVVRVSSCHFPFLVIGVSLFPTIARPGRRVAADKAPRGASIRHLIFFLAWSRSITHAASFPPPPRLFPLTIGARAHEACLMN